MKVIKIEINNEMHATWLRLMIENEIEDIKGTILNERIWKKGSDGEALLMHELNIQCLVEYQKELESVLLAMDDV